MSAFFPERTAIEAYGGGGFRFAHLSHKGSLLILPSGMHGWPPSDCSVLRIEDFRHAFAVKSGIEIFLLGTGQRMQRPPRAIIAAFAEAKLPLDFMDTSAAISTYNLLLGERRLVAAALIAVVTPK